MPRLYIFHRSAAPREPTKSNSLFLFMFFPLDLGMAAIGEPKWPLTGYNNKP